MELRPSGRDVDRRHLAHELVESDPSERVGHRPEDAGVVAQGHACPDAHRMARRGFHDAVVLDVGLRPDLRPVEVAAQVHDAERRVAGLDDAGPAAGLRGEEVGWPDDVRVFVDTPDDIRLMRRLRRDINERGRTFERTLDQYERTIRPMHFEFVEPSKRFADIIIPEGSNTGVTVEFLCSMVREKLNSEQRTDV